VLAQIVKLMRDAQGSRAPIQALADRISAVFVPVVLSIAIATFVAWFVAAHATGTPPARPSCAPSPRRWRCSSSPARARWGSPCPPR
jgi:cation transport ATPase